MARDTLLLVSCYTLRSVDRINNPIRSALLQAVRRFKP